MPSQLTYPGVYIEEIPSGVRTITGVATSITAFIGRARKGPLNEPKTINSYADFERIFGGLWKESTLGFAVRDFFLNGGSQAIIVRLYHPTSVAAGAGELATARATLDANGLKLEAAYEGSWANSLRARVDHDVKGPDAPNIFNLSILLIDVDKTRQIEVFRNVSVVPGHKRQVNKVLENESRLVRVLGNPPASHPEPHDPGIGKDVWGDNVPATNSKVEKMASDGNDLENDDFAGSGKEDAKEGLYSLQKADLFNILCIPPLKADASLDANLIDKAIEYCQDHRAMMIIDPPREWDDKYKAISGIETQVGSISKNAAIFFPRLSQPNPLNNNQMENFVPCGAVAGIFARTDTQRGVWKAPAGLDATLVGVPQLSVPLTDNENGELNPLGINCLRALPAAGRVVWGSRTRVGDDRLASEWKYIPVRRMALFIEESLYRGTKWVVFEPNDEPLWAQIRLNIGAFMHNLFRQGAFQGKTPQEAYFVKCDKETTTQSDINLGIVNIIVGFAPLKPAEFVVIKLQQMAGEIQT